MKISDVLSETPYWIKSNADKVKLSPISVNGLERDYKLLSSENNIEIWQGDCTDGYCNVVLGARDNDKFLVFVNLDLTKFDEPGLKVSKQAFQVSYVNTDKNMINRTLATSLYKALNQIGVIVVSDTIQYNGGVYLWKKLAADSSTNVYIYDMNKEEYLTDENGNPIQYNGQNFDDEDIWGWDEHQSNTSKVLVLK